MASLSGGSRIDGCHGSLVHFYVHRSDRAGLHYSHILYVGRAIVAYEMVHRAVGRLLKDYSRTDVGLQMLSCSLCSDTRHCSHEIQRDEAHAEHLLADSPQPFRQPLKRTELDERRTSMSAIRAQMNIVGVGYKYRLL
ncbi:hypothetical protein PM082_016537 [Marasmius tenuissimus]|nr:hypothetical protein PM082_016537 [Marasmius tenuissimus]